MKIEDFIKNKIIELEENIERCKKEIPQPNYNDIAYFELKAQLSLAKEVLSFIEKEQKNE